MNASFPNRIFNLLIDGLLTNHTLCIVIFCTVHRGLGFPETTQCIAYFQNDNCLCILNFKNHVCHKYQRFYKNKMGFSRPMHFQTSLLLFSVVLG